MMKPPAGNSNNMTQRPNIPRLRPRGMLTLINIEWRDRLLRLLGSDGCNSRSWRAALPPALPSASVLPQRLQHCRPSVVVPVAGLGVGLICPGAGRIAGSPAPASRRERHADLGADYTKTPVAWPNDRTQRRPIAACQRKSISPVEHDLRADAKQRGARVTRPARAHPRRALAAPRGVYLTIQSLIN